MSVDYFVKAILEIKKRLNGKDLVGAGGLLDRMMERSTWAAEQETLEQLANCFFLLEGESPQDVSEYWFTRKKEKWDKYPQLQAFFLNSAFGIIRTTETLSETDLLNYLKKKRIEDALHSKSAR